MKFNEWLKPWMKDMFSPAELKRMESVWNFAKADSRQALEAIVEAYHTNGAACQGMDRMLEIAVNELDAEPRRDGIGLGK